MLLAAIVCAGWSADAQARRPSGYQLVQREAGGARITTLVSRLGTRSRQLRRQGGRWRVRGGSIVRYRDRAVFVLDPLRREYVRVSLRARLAEAERDLRALQRSSASERFPTPSGRPKRVAVSATRARFRRRVAGIRAEGLRVKTGPTVERLWYARSLPAPPAAFRDELAELGELTVGQGDRAAARLSDQTLLRREQLRDGRWVRVLDTIRVRRVRFSRRALVPPARYVRDAGDRRTSNVPGFLQPQGGAVANDPSVFAVYWGSPFVSSTFGTTMDGILRSFMTRGSPYREYWGPMAQYDIRPRRFNGSVTVAADPYRTVGTWNVLDVTATVYGAQIAAGAPAVWTIFSDDDPVIALFIAASTVNPGAWDGYHFWAPSIGALAGWPLSIFIRPGIPWLIVRVPDDSGLTSRAAMDGAMASFSHEMLEAASDPFPFSGWVDLGLDKIPVWERGEVVDICGIPPTFPWGSATRIIRDGAKLATYWSNRDGACVPESRPTIQLFGVTEGQALRRDRASIVAVAGDPLDGDISDRVRWTDATGKLLAVGRFIDLSKRLLPLGTHTLTATATDSQGLSVSQTVTFSLFAEPPSVMIDAPLEGATLGVGPVNLRGDATDPQDGRIPGSGLVWRVDGTQVGTGAQISTPLTAGDHTITLRVTNSDGISAEAVRHVHAVAGAPTVAITQPPNNSDFPSAETVPVTFSASAVDPQDGPLSGASVEWFDSYGSVVNQSLGTGTSISRTLVHDPVDHANGRQTVHTISVVARDAGGNVATDTVTVTVGILIN